MDKLSAIEFDSKYDILDVVTPRHSPLSGRYKKSFAYYTLRERLPVILTTILDNLTKDKDELAAKFSEDSREEIKTVIGKISQLKYQLQTDKPLEVFTGNEPDKETWNKFIKKLEAQHSTFFKTCWLYAECYMYRKVSSFFEATSFLKDYDYFEKQKINATTSNHEAMESIITALNESEKTEQMFRQLLKVNLWGNRCDLSISNGKEVDANQNTFELISHLDPNIVIDESNGIVNCLKSADKSKPVIVDFVLDNAGFEFFTDLVLAAYMVENKLATKVRFHVKALPWYISDVTAKDFHWTLQYYKQHKSPVLREQGRKWVSFMEQGLFELQPTEHFWTSASEYYKMRDLNKPLYDTLSEAHLIIFKGDLNYRKLLGDFSWDFTAPFLTCLRGFQPSNLCTLRTVKADLICDMSATTVERLNRTQPDWMINGQYGVIQFAQNTHCACPLKT